MNELYIYILQKYLKLIAKFKHIFLIPRNKLYEQNLIFRCLSEFQILLN